MGCARVEAQRVGAGGGQWSRVSFVSWSWLGGRDRLLGDAVAGGMSAGKVLAGVPVALGWGKDGLVGRESLCRWS